MARGPNEKAAKAEKLYRAGMKLVDIAKELEVPDGTIRRWKSTYHWDQEKKERSIKKSERSDKKSNAHRTIKEEAESEAVDMVLENSELTDKQRLFCIYYVRSFNATKAYQKAYGSSYNVANAEGYKLLVNPCVKQEIMRLKRNRLNREMLSEEDIFQKYMDIAFADITDYLEFGTEDVPVMGDFGPIMVEKDESGKKEALMQTVNVVHFKQSCELDGTILSEVKQGRNGASIKLADRMQALKWLSEHMNIASESQKLQIERQTLEIDRQKLEIDKQKLEIEKRTTELAILKAKSQENEPGESDDGFIEALNLATEEDWIDEEE